MTTINRLKVHKSRL